MSWKSINFQLPFTFFRLKITKSNVIYNTELHISTKNTRKSNKVLFVQIFITHTQQCIHLYIYWTEWLKWDDLNCLEKQSTHKTFCWYLKFMRNNGKNHENAFFERFLGDVGWNPQYDCNYLDDINMTDVQCGVIYLICYKLNKNNHTLQINEKKTERFKDLVIMTRTFSFPKKREKNLFNL